MTSGSPTADASDLLREADRVADRLRVLGPRWAARRHEPDAAAVAAVRAALQRLADLAVDAEPAVTEDGNPRRPVPELAPRALADQVLVLAHEAARAGVAVEATQVLIGLRRAL